MNINEFERTKPRKAHSALQRLIKKYSPEPLAEALSEEEEFRRKMIQEVKDDLLKLKEIFLTGE
tara:strand:+ start:996 stop:1187 length:192 start_codon:yes stop_codon:yes gene_type:complete